MPVKRASLASRITADSLVGGDVEASPGRGRTDVELAEPNIKMTAYITPEQDIALDEMRIARRRADGSRVDKSALLREAIDLLLAREKAS